LTDEWARHPVTAEKPDNNAGSLRALTTYCHAIVNTAAFLYVD
jgi:hypothetical protein